MTKKERSERAIALREKACDVYAARAGQLETVRAKALNGCDMLRTAGEEERAEALRAELEDAFEGFVKAMDDIVDELQCRADETGRGEVE